MFAVHTTFTTEVVARYGRLLYLKSQAGVRSLEIGHRSTLLLVQSLPCYSSFLKDRSLAL